MSRVAKAPNVEAQDRRERPLLRCRCERLKDSTIFVDQIGRQRIGPVLVWVTTRTQNLLLNERIQFLGLLHARGDPLPLPYPQPSCIGLNDRAHGREAVRLHTRT